MKRLQRSNSSGPFEQVLFYLFVLVTGITIALTAMVSM